MSKKKEKRKQKTALEKFKICEHFRNQIKTTSTEPSYPEDGRLGRASLEKLWRSKYDLGEKFGDAVTKVMNPICIKVHKGTESGKKGVLLEERPTSAENRVGNSSKVGYPISSGPHSGGNPERKTM